MDESVPGLSSELRELCQTQTASAARLVARAMRDNPTHEAVFGTSPARRERRLIRFFGGVIPLILSKGTIIGTWDGDRLVGLLGILPPGTCRATLGDALRMAPALLTSNSAAGILRIRRWHRAWRESDPEAGHWHLGPLAVEPERQRQGIGTRLLGECCRRADAEFAMSYLETDKPRNVALYRRFDFEVIEQKTVLGVRNWFMQRGPGTRRAHD